MYPDAGSIFVTALSNPSTIKIGASRLEAACTLLWARRQLLVHLKSLESRACVQVLVDALQRGINRTTCKKGHANAQSPKKIEECDRYQSVEGRMEDYALYYTSESSGLYTQ